MDVITRASLRNASFDQGDANLEHHRSRWDQERAAFFKFAQRRGTNADRSKSAGVQCSGRKKTL
jgi:hypothetical protein